MAVSTHSRPKAAANITLAAVASLPEFQHTAARRRLRPVLADCELLPMFQHTAARRRLRLQKRLRAGEILVSTHSRPKAAAIGIANRLASSIAVSTHSRPKAAATTSACLSNIPNCFNTQPPEGGCRQKGCLNSPSAGFNTQPPEGGCLQEGLHKWRICKFQHTAARRRLRVYSYTIGTWPLVSTHSRPKAAAQTSITN